MNNKDLKVAVLGAGAMGCLFGGLLAEKGLNVTLIDVWKEHVEEINKNSPFSEDNTASDVNKNSNLIGSNTPAGNSSGLFAFIPTKPLDGYNFSNITYGIVGA